MNFEIDYLSNFPEWIPILANWTYSEWGKHDPENSLELTVNRYRERLKIDSLPLMLVAFEGASPIGCVSLKKSEMTIRPNYSPWLGSMYVVKDKRNNGVGSALLNRAVAESKKLLISELYLWTAHAEDFYKAYGFDTIEHVQYENQNAKIMYLRNS